MEDREGGRDDCNVQLQSLGTDTVSVCVTTRIIKFPCFTFLKPALSLSSYSLKSLYVILLMVLDVLGY